MQNNAPARREDVFTDVVMWNSNLVAGITMLEQEAEAFGEMPLLLIATCQAVALTTLARARKTKTLPSGMKTTFDWTVTSTC